MVLIASDSQIGEIYEFIANKGNVSIEEIVKEFEKYGFEKIQRDLQHLIEHNKITKTFRRGIAYFLLTLSAQLERERK